MKILNVKLECERKRGRERDYRILNFLLFLLVIIDYCTAELHVIYVQ